MSQPTAGWLTPGGVCKCHHHGVGDLGIPSGFYGIAHRRRLQRTFRLSHGGHPRRQHRCPVSSGVRIDCQRPEEHLRYQGCHNPTHHAYQSSRLCWQHGRVLLLRLWPKRRSSDSLDSVERTRLFVRISFNRSHRCLRLVDLAASLLRPL